MTTTTYKQVKHRHPWRGLFFGFLFGVGLFMMAILYGWYWVGQYTPWILLVLGVVLGLLISYIPRPWGNRPAPDAGPTTTPPPAMDPPTAMAPPPAPAPTPHDDTERTEP